jgi:hypothetical protein
VRSWVLVGFAACRAGGDPTATATGLTADSAAPTRTPIDPTDPTDPTDPDPTVAECAEPLGIAWIAEPGGPELAAGDPVVLAHGPQGGWHVAVNAGIVGATTGNVLAGAVVERAATGDQLAGDDNRFGLAVWGWSPSTCAGDLRGMLAYLDDLPGVDQDFVCGLVGERLRLQLQIEDLEGEGADAVELEVVAVADPADPC